MFECQNCGCQWWDDLEFCPDCGSDEIFEYYDEKELDEYSNLDDNKFNNW